MLVSLLSLQCLSSNFKTFLINLMVIKALNLYMSLASEI